MMSVLQLRLKISGKEIQYNILRYTVIFCHFIMLLRYIRPTFSYFFFRLI